MTLENCIFTYPASVGNAPSADSDTPPDQYVVLYADIPLRPPVPPPLPLCPTPACPPTPPGVTLMIPQADPPPPPPPAEHDQLVPLPPLAKSKTPDVAISACAGPEASPPG